MKTKTCTKCGEVKALDEFSKRREGLRAACKSCISIQSSEYRELNREKIRNLMKIHNAKNKIKKAEFARRDNALHPRKYYSNTVAWQKNNKGKVKESALRKAADLTDCYVCNQLGIHVSDCPADLIEIKREQIQIHRLTKQLNQAIKDAQK